MISEPGHTLSTAVWMVTLRDDWAREEERALSHADLVVGEESRA